MSEAPGGDGSDGGAETPYSAESMAEAVTDAAIPDVAVGDEDGDDDTLRVSRTAAFADVANRPKETAIEQSKYVNDVVFYRKLTRLDGDLAGTLRAKTQVASMGPEVTHPAMRGHEEELSDTEREIMQSCDELMDRLNLKREMGSFYRNLVAHGNDVTHVEYADGEGVTDVQELPLQALTIVDEEVSQNLARGGGGMGGDVMLDPGEESTGSTDMDKTIHEDDYYVLNEDNADTREVYPESDILHMAINKRGNWYQDRLGRDTYGVWGERRLEPIKFALQAKQNTLANKVALDDSMLAREIYHIDVEALFGHIPNDQERTQKAEEYKDQLKAKLNDLDPDEKPILPQEVEVSVEGPDGSTADNQSSFIDMMNNTLQHALTFHSASFGRDAGGSMAGNQPAKEMSDTGVKSLRDVVKREFRELFKIHTLLAFPQARQPATNPDGTRKTDVEGYRQWELKDDITLPILSFDPVSRRDKSDRVKDAVSAYEKGVADLNEARAWVDLDPIDEDDVDEMFFRRDPTAMEDPTAQPDGEGGVGREHNESEPDNNQGPGQGDNPNDDGSGEAS